MRMSRAMAAGALAFALLGAACANDDGGNAGSGGGSTGCSGDRQHGSTGSSGGGSLRRRWGLRERRRHDRQHGHRWRHQRPHADAGQLPVHAREDHRDQGDTITVSDTNPSTPHTFTVTGTDIDVSNDAMSAQDVTIDLAPGTYPFICRFHEGQGMTGTLVVK